MCIFAKTSKVFKVVGQIFKILTYITDVTVIQIENYPWSSLVENEYVFTLIVLQTQVSKIKYLEYFKNGVKVWL